MSPPGRLLPLLMVGGLTFGCARDGRTSFHFSGSITAPPPIQKLTQRPNLVLFIVATNNSGVPVAIKKIINPTLPVHYRMNAEDLVLPGPAWAGPLQVRVVVNSHGTLGVTLKGDLRGTHRGEVWSGGRDINVVIDQQD
ncbi:MAG: hypothetical protein ABIJ96_16535 [Elusimicrobiota bacterium]